MLLVLMLVAWLSPAPQPSDHAMMEYVGRGVVVPGCAALNCFRILVPAVVAHLPGPLEVRWRGYAVVANAAAAIAAAYLALELGLPAAAATWTAWLAALGAGSFATIHHPYNADPFVWLLAPLTTTLLMRERRAAVAALSAAGVLAKEFGAAPLYISAAAAALGRRWTTFRWQLALAVAVTLFWVTVQLTLMLVLDYSYDDNPSSRLLDGGYLGLWLRHVTPITGALAVFGTFGAVYLLLPAGWRLAPPPLKQLALGAVPAMMAFVYVATPERVLWNFFFLVLPIGALVLARMPLAAAASFVALYGAANLRIGAQIAQVPNSRYAVALSVCLAVVAIWMARHPRGAVREG